MGKRKIIFAIGLGGVVIAIAAGILIYINSQNVSFTSSNTESIFLQELPGYPNATLVSASGEFVSGKAISKIWETSDSPEIVSAFYKNELEKGGWQITAQLKEAEFVSYSFEKGKASGFVGIGKTNKVKTVITLTMWVK